MDTIKVNKEELLTILRRNRETHTQEAAEALTGWKAKVVETLEGALQKAVAGTEYITSFPLPKPTDYTSMYDQTIGMLEIHTEDIVELDRTEFASYVQDNWRWKGDFVASTRMYNNAK